MNVINLTIKSQIVDRNKTWNYLEVMIPVCEKSVGCEGKFYQNYQYTFGNDTVINHKVYTEVIETMFFSDNSSPYDQIVGYLREDTALKKVYCHFPSSIDDSTEVLLYDFTLKKDSMFQSMYNQVYHMKEGDKTVSITFFSAKVLATDSIVCEGMKRHRILFSDFYNNWIFDFEVQDTVTWIEGIGSNKGLLNYRYGYQYLLCCKQNDELMYFNPYGLKCDFSGFPDNVNTAGSGEIKIFPNPVQEDVLYIQGSFIQYIYIYNIHGKLVGQYFPESTFCELSLPDLPAGFYIIRVNHDNYTLVVQ